jgi:hypothetical protein
MTTVLISLAFIAMVVVLYFYHLAGMTHPENKAVREGLEQSVAVGILNYLEGHHLTSTHRWLGTEQHCQDHDRDFMKSIMPWMYEEARKVAWAARSPLALWRFCCFCAVYSAIWIKVRVRPSAWDLRYLAGAELPLLRRAA